MIKIYKFPLILSNYKLYNSPYNKNIVEVYDTLKNYKLKCRLNYLNNLKTLKIEKSLSFNSEETLYDLIENNFGCARYYPKKNLIELNQNYDKIEETINHELFHVSSNNPNNPYMLNFEGSINIIEGITDYLGKKSKNNKYTPGYKLELLVIEFLISVLGENKIIEPYLLDDYKLFYKNTNFIMKEIKEIAKTLVELDEISKKSIIRKICLFLGEKYPNIIKDKNISTIELTLESTNYDRIINMFKEDKIKETLSKISLDEFIDYQYKEQKSKELEDTWDSEKFDTEKEKISIIYNNFNKIIEKYPKIRTYKYVDDFLDKNLSKDEKLRLQFKMVELESTINYLTKFKSRKKEVK